MRFKWMLACGTAAVLGLTGCPGDEGGGGGDEPATISYDGSNPQTREEEGSGGALPMEPVPVGPEARAQFPGVAEGYFDTETTVIAQGGDPSLRVNVNTASVDELDNVPGIGRDLAQAIVKFRPFSSAEDMAESIPNLTPAYVDSFEQYLEFGGATEGRS